MAAFTLRVLGFFDCGKVKSTTAEPSESPLKQLSSRSLSLQLTWPGGVSRWGGLSGRRGERNAGGTTLRPSRWLKLQTKEKEGDVTI